MRPSLSCWMGRCARKFCTVEAKSVIGSNGRRTLLTEEIQLLVGNETEDYILLKKESLSKGSSR